MTNKKAGRKPSPLPTRDRQISCFLTNEDVEWLNDFASAYGFKSRSELMTAVFERLIMCGFSGFGSLRMAMQLQKRCEEVNPERASQRGFDFTLLRPLPALPDVHIDAVDFKRTLDEIQADFRNERKAL